MRKLSSLVAISAAFSCATPSLAAGPAGDPPKPAAGAPSATDAAKADAKPNELKAEEVITRGAVTVGGKRIEYQAIAGTLVVKPKGAEDAPEPDPSMPADKQPPPPAQAAMSFVAYFAGGKADPSRPVTFIYNGGPGSATIWLHMGAFGPRRVVTADDTHTKAAPYQIVDNAYSLLDASDLVFIDAPGTGFGKVVGKDKEKAFWGVDADAHAFSEFIAQFLSKYGRWNSPKYLFGESYGTTRSAVLALELATEKSIDVNGVILLSQILSFNLDADTPEANPGAELAYVTSLPTYAATAWYHKKLPEMPKALEPFLAEVEHFATTDYAVALLAGNALDPGQRKSVLDKLHAYTGLPVAYLDKANLRVSAGEFEKQLADDDGMTVGRLDSRFSGPTMDPLSKEADYDPQSAAISPAYVAAFNDYARQTLKFGAADRTYLPLKPLFMFWDWKHRAPGGDFPLPTTVNVMNDLAAAMKLNPNLKVQLEAGYFDVATPFYEGVYELEHLPIPKKLQGNIDFRFYPSGHMVYANEKSLKLLHDNVAQFIKNTATK